MSQEGKKLKNYTSLNFNGQEMNQEEASAFIADVSQRVNGLLGEVSGKVKDVLDGTPPNVNQGSTPPPTTLWNQLQQLLPRVETSKQNGTIKMTLDGDPLIEINLSHLFNKQ